MKILSCIIISIILFAYPFLNFDFFFLSWIFLIPILFLLEEDKISPTKLGLIFGTTSILIMTHWGTPTLSRLTGANLNSSFLIHLGYAIYESIFYILIFIFTKFILNTARNFWHKYLLIIFFYILLEQNFPRIFPYSLGNTQVVFNQILQLVSFAGINMVSILVLLVNFAFYELLKKKKANFYVFITIFIFSIIIGWTIGEYRTNYKKNLQSINIAVLQPGNSIKKIVELQTELDKKTENLYITVWPESSLNKVILRNSEDYKIFTKAFSKKFSFKSKYLLLGSIVENRVGFYNSAILIDENYEIIDLYFKNKLMIFGEYYPAKKLISKIIPIYKKFINLNKGDIKTLTLENSNIGVLICYEDLFSSNGIELTKNGAEILINITNDSWYGDSIASYQHLMLSIPRVIENRKFLIRSALNGESAIISPNGKIIKKIERNKEGYLLHKVHLTKEISFYSEFYSLVNFFYYLIFFLLVYLLYMKKNFHKRK